MTSKWPIAAEYEPPTGPSAIHKSAKYLLTKLTLNPHISGPIRTHGTSFGHHGEVFVTTNDSIIQIWSWKTHSGVSNGLLNLVGGIKLPVKVEFTSDDDNDNDQLGLDDIRIWPIICNQQSNYFKILVKIGGRLFICDNAHFEREMSLPDSWSHGDWKVVTNDKWLIFGDNTTGEILILDSIKAKEAFKLKTKIHNGQAIFDLKSNWLVLLSEDKPRLL